MRKTLALLCLLAAPAGAYDLRGIEPGKALDPSALPPGVTCAGQLCHGFMDVLDFTTVVDIIKGDDGTVLDVSASFTYLNFGKLAKALTDKYGKPKQSATVEKANAFGARTTSKMMLWEQDGYQMLLDERSGSLTDGALSIRVLDKPRQSAGI